MPIKKYTVEVTRVDEYQIDIDTDVWNEEMIAEFDNYIYKSEDYEDIVIHLSKSISHQGKAQAMEGFGFVKQRFHRMEPGESFTQRDSKGFPLEESDYTKGLSVNIISYEEYDEVTLFKNK